MKALILAAGYGTRLYPITKNKAKSLLEVHEKPILYYILEKLSEVEDLAEILIVTNDKFYSHFVEKLKDYKSKKTIKVINDYTLSNETRLGAMGDIHYVIETENIKEDLLVIGGDNLFKFSLVDFINFQRTKNSSILAGHIIENSEEVKKHGVLSLKEEKIIDFEEKPKNPKTNIASTCIYYFNSLTLPLLSTYVTEENSLDKTGEFIQWLHKKTDVHAFIFNSKLYDIGSLSGLKEARKNMENN